MKKLLWVGDAVCPSGFSRATHEILDTLRYVYDVTVLGINHRGDPHGYGYPIYAAMAGGDGFGVERLLWLCYMVKPDVIVIQQDGWNIPFYMERLSQIPEYAAIPVVAVVAVDGKNFQGEWLKGVSLAVFWTQFALAEARAGGYEGKAVVIPLGVDLSVYRPVDRMEARARRFPPTMPCGRKSSDIFVVGNVNRNQPRKRWDLTLKYFAEWVYNGIPQHLRHEKLRVVNHAYLYLHCAPTGDNGVDVRQLAKYYGIFDRLILLEPPVFQGMSEDDMRDTYNFFDVQISTTQGEGFGLTTFEGMACGVPQIVPDWAALGELCKDAVVLVPCTSTALNPITPSLNVIGGVADERQFVASLKLMHDNPEYRSRVALSGTERTCEDRFRWQNVGDEYLKALYALLDAPVQESNEDAWRDLGRPEETTRIDEEQTSQSGQPGLHLAPSSSFSADPRRSEEVPT